MPASIQIDDAPIYNSDGADDDDKAIEELRKKLDAAPPTETPPPADDAPPADETPAGDPPAGDPPADETPAGDPPAGDAPAGDPPADDDAPPAGDPPPTDKKGVMIPKQRYDSMRARYDDLDRRFKELEAKVKTPDQAPGPDPLAQIEEELAAIDEPLAKAYADGDAVKIKELRAKERTLLTQRTDIVADRRSAATTNAITAQTAYDQAVTALETTYPILNPENADQYDEELTNELGELVAAYTKLGHAPVAALRKATKTLEHRLKVNEPASTSTADDAAAKVKQAEEAAAKAAARKTGAVQKAVAAASKQPSATGKTGADSDKRGARTGTPNPNDLSDEEYDALPEETRRRMRGDFMTGKSA